MDRAPRASGPTIAIQGLRPCPWHKTKYNAPRASGPAYRWKKLPVSCFGTAKTSSTGKMGDDSAPR